MRRSARETRRPEFLTYQASTSIPEDQSDSDHNSEPNEVKAKKKRERSSAKKEESGEGEEESDFEENEPKAKRPTKKAKKAATNTKEKNAEEEGKVRDISLFDSVLTFAGKDFSSLCNGWLEKHQESPVQSWTELMNFVLMSAGLEKDSIHPDTDLDALNPEEIENMLAKTLEMTQRGAKSYPLNEKPKNKSSVPYRTKYQSFWQCLAQKLFELKDHLPSSSAGSAKSRRSTNTVKSNRGVELMNQLVDYLASFSSLPSVNVRDAVAEAALSLAEGAIPLANQLKEATITADRQLHQSSSTSLKNPKSKAFAEQKEEYSHDLNLWSEVISSVFNTIYISRSKDFNEDVRLVCVRHLEQMIRFDVSRPVKTEYLKYLGWACYDHAHAIRFEAVRAINNLIQDDAIIGSLVNFVLHFMDRFIEIASCDIDADVSLEMISTMRVMQKQGFLDTVSEDKLDMVDVIIFDPDATSEMRREALLFLMDHTEGFDLPLEAEEEKGTQKARSKSSDKKATKNRPGEFNKNIAFQLETLTEFAEHNLTPETVDWSFLLAEACLETDKAPILYDWNTAISLLTKDFEDEELIAKPLRDIQIAILLQLMLTAAKQVNSQRKQLEEHGIMKGNSREKELVNHRWESLNQSLGSKLSSLLTRFKDNDKNLGALTELLSCCEISTTMKSSQTLIKSIKDIFLTFNSESLLRNILLALRRWKVDDVFDNLFNLSVASFQTNSVEFEKRETNEAEDHRKNQQKNHRRRSSSTNRGVVTERRDALLDSIHKLGGDMMRLRLLFENVDCRQFLRKDSEKNLIIQVEEVASHLIETLKKAEEDFSLIQRTDLEVLNQLAHDLLFGIFALVLWKYNDVMNLGDVMELSETRRQSRIKANGSSKESQSEGDQLALEDVLDQKDISLLNSKIEDLLEVREKLVEMSLSYMKYLKFVSEAVNSSDEEISVAEAFAISGFRMISYLRSYFPLRQNKYLGVDRILFQPSSEALGLLKFVFDNISQRINEQLDQLEVDNEATTDQNGQEKKLSRVLIEQLLLPLSGSFVYDTENFNRRQTAAVLLFILHRNPSVVEAVKTIAKKLRDKELVAYLEAQFVALKSCFTEEVLRPLSLKQQAENAEDDVDFDFADNEASIQSGYERLIAYSRKFSSLLGVGKLKESALEAVEAFLRLAVEFTFTDALHVGFCEALAPFLRFLPAIQKKELHQFLLNELETNEKYSDLLSEFTRQKAVPDVEFQRFFLFLEQLSTGQAAGMPSKQSKRKLSSSQIHSTTEPRDQEVPKVAAKPSMASQTPTKKGSTSKNKSSRMSKISNVTLSPIRETRRSSRNAGKKVKYNEGEEDEDGIEEFDDEEEEEGFTSQKAKTSQKTKRDQVPATPTSLNSFATGLDIEDYEDVEESPRPRGSQRRNNSSSNKRSREELADTNFIPSELLILDTSPIQLSGIEDLENVPRRRKLLS